MASELTAAYAGTASVHELIAYTKKELDADEERQKKGGVQHGLEGQTGATLDLSHKNIHALPVEIVALIKDKVERLALSHNPQIQVPSEIVQCDRLRYLNIRWNQLKVFPEAVLQLSSLEILDISKNRITSIPEGIRNMTSLKFLAVARNKITRLPLALGDMPSLHKLKFDENPLVFPPEEALKPESHYMASSIESEKDVCQQVKRFLKAASLRERLRPKTSEDDMSESNVETPRPPKRSATIGRFPIRPSISGVENAEDTIGRSPGEMPPPIPQRSHARDVSTNAPVVRRPGITPLLTGYADVSRSRSVTISSSASIRARRQGFVPRKTALDANTVSVNGPSASARSIQATIKPSHSRATSSISTLNGFLSASSEAESSGAASPVDGGLGIFGSVHKLWSLPETRNSKAQLSDAVKAAKRLRFSLVRLQGPMGEISTTIKSGLPKRSILERQIFSADALVEELNRLIKQFEESMVDTNGVGGQRASAAIVTASLAALKAFGAVVRDMQAQVQRIVSITDAAYVRCLMAEIYMTIVETRNICSILGYRPKAAAARNTPRASRAWSSKTITPTQAKPVSSRRLRGATIFQSMGSQSNLRSAPPPVPLHTNGSRSRTNTMTSVGATPPNFNGPYTSTLPSGTMPSRSNTLRSVNIDDQDNDEQFGNIFLNLRRACDFAASSLPHCRTEFSARKENAENAGWGRAATHWAMALKKCDAVIAANQVLMSRLKVLKLKDPAVRNQRDFWQLCDAFVQAWADLATEIKDIGQQRIDITTVRTAMRPVQKAVKDVSKTISESPLYHQAVRPGAPYPPGLAPAFPSHVNTGYPGLTSYGLHSGQNSGHITPVPATPLSAALGPAIQATVANSQPNTATQIPMEFGAYQQPPHTAGLYGMERPSFDRSQTSVPVERTGYERTNTMQHIQGYGRGR
ncbi:hypothetical protein EJ03DRAFT_377553 [Teratosphaeria nubilosa]|uniref:Disease resistance R13L4/SHOC-2-like LRR domain-containing protein n=1 Tax=Teratosphaeria nubilosa TaxID=161662 RepID=A0A6G1KYN8_9PEZI|nr:hypothetical protein EJ03DRAFT_377553 [Teratosphaeria nubilosa]